MQGKGDVDEHFHFFRPFGNEDSRKIDMRTNPTFIYIRGESMIVSIYLLIFKPLCGDCGGDDPVLDLYSYEYVCFSIPV